MTATPQLRFSCPQCGAHISVSSEHAGKRGKCARCGMKMRIPAPQSLETIPESHKQSVSVDVDAQKIQEGVASLLHEQASLALQCQQARATLDGLTKEVALLEENLEDISYGLYRPHFTYDASEAYKAAISAVREKQKLMVRAGEAATCATQWTVGESRREGEKMTKQYQKLLLRAFNGEGEAAIANVSWNNYRIMGERIRKAQEAINAMGSVMQMTISDGYRDLKLEELRLVFERAEKKQQELDEQRRLRAKARDEEQAQREFARETDRAEKERSQYEIALVNARQAAEAAAEDKRHELQERIAELECRLKEAEANKERAIAQAQLTKSGHVYIISNIGSFGEKVYKIGMTRRLDPSERIRELGDASVPFGFDVHAVIYSEDAPGLEGAFHDRFEASRINRSNNRKEFFRVGLEEIEAFVCERGLKVDFARLAEAKEYRLTLAGAASTESEADDADEMLLETLHYG